MFLIYSIEDRLLLKPDDLNYKNDTNIKLYEDIILEKAREKYIGKVLLNHGIGVSIKKLSLKKNQIIEIEGLINVEYDCELILFSPQKNDILYGKILSQDYKSIIVDCGIVKVIIPYAQLMTPNDFDEGDKIWYWNYNDYKLYYDISEDVRIKIVDIKYKSGSEIKKNFANSQKQEDFNSEFLTSEPILGFENIMDVVGTFNQEGLGPIKWWQN